MKKILGVVILLIIALPLTSLLAVAVLAIMLKNEDPPDTSYVDSVPWGVDDATFDSEYVAVYQSLIEDLLTKHDMPCFKNESSNNGHLLEYCNEYYKLSISLFNWEQYDCGYVKVSLYVFNDNVPTLFDYDSQKKYIAFMDDLFDCIAYESSSDINEFDDLYKSAVKSESYSAGVSFYDDVVDRISRGVGLHKDSGTDKNYMLEDHSFTYVPHNSYSFQACLKHVS